MKRYMASLSKNQMQLIPFGHFRIIAECLLAINTKDSYRLIEPLLFHTAAKCNSFLNNMSIACCFLLALNQVILPINDLNYQKKNKKTKQRLLFFFSFKNQLEAAYELTSRLANNRTLELNMRAIVYSRLMRVDKAYECLRELSLIESNENRRSDKLIGHAFPLAVCHL